MKKPKKEFKYIELFAGCGGLSLGLEATGFKLMFANELSPMAAATYAQNLLGEDLEAICNETWPRPNRTKWINSRKNIHSLASRLGENPTEPPQDDEAQCDFSMPLDLTEVEGKLIVGSLVKLNELIERSPSFIEQLRGQEVDVVSGGPPCQSFSMAGMRQLSNERNTLPWEFARFVGLARPKAAVLENVKGILHAFTIPGDKKQTQYHAWHEVAKAFVERGYIPICLHVNAKYAGVAQNRPRFIMIALRHDFFEAQLNKLGIADIVENAQQFYDKVKAKPDVTLNESGLRYWDIERSKTYFEKGVLSPFLRFYGRSDKPFHTVKDAIDDLRATPAPLDRSSYVDLIDKTFEQLRPQSSKLGAIAISNHNTRFNSLKVRQRFRIYQVLEKIRIQDSALYREILSFMKNGEPKLRDQAVSLLRQECFLLQDELVPKGRLEKLSPATRETLESFLQEFTTRKQTQRALDPTSPAPAAMSIPDDCCHYSEEIDDIRTLTVREMARIQSFPDWFVFKSKETTGGKMRRFQVPQYTQVGNAVPPLLGFAIGNCLRNIFKAL